MAKIQFDNFYMILSETKYIDTAVNNVSYHDEIKKLIKAKKAYSTDFELEPFHLVTRKVVVPSIDIDNLNWHFDWLSYQADTMGSITEFGWLPAISMGYFDYYTNQDTNAYISPLFEIIGTDNKGLVRSESNIQNYINNTTNEIFEFLKNDDFDGLSEYLEDLQPFEFDPNQMQLEFAS